MSAPLPTAGGTRLHTLTSLISSSSAGGPSCRIYPNDDAIVNLLHSRSRLELPYARLNPSSTHLVVVNPLRSLGCMNETSRSEYQREVQGTERVPEERQPSVYELAGRVWMLMHRLQESQSVIYHGLTGSGKSTASRHFTTQLLALSSTTKAQKRLSDQISCFLTILKSFGHSKTSLNPSASQHSKYFELHFSFDGHIVGAKILPFGLNKFRVGRLRHDERSFHVFYQLLAGASPEERDALNLDDPSGYAMLASSGCYRLPGGPFSDDSTQLQELRVAMASLGFKAKHVRSVFTLLTAILLLSNLSFADDRAAGSLGMSSIDERSHIIERQVLVEVAAHLGVPPEDLEAVLTSRTKWVRRDLCSMFLDARGSAAQRDSLMRDLYAILWTWVVEMANKRLAPSGDAPADLQIVQLDIPGFQSRTTSEPASARPASVMSFGPLVNASGENGFDEFANNYVNEIVQAYLVKRAFEDSDSTGKEMQADGLRLPAVVPTRQSGCLELLCGHTAPGGDGPGGLSEILIKASEDFKGEEQEDVKGEQTLERMVESFERHSSFVVSPGLGTGPLPNARHTFGVNHWAGCVTYDCTDFADRNSDVLDKQLVDLLRSSSDPFVAKLVSGPGLATEGHPLDPAITVEAQVSITPLRTPTSITSSASHAQPRTQSRGWGLDTSMPQPVVLQLHSTLSRILQEIDRTRFWTVACIRPNDSGHPNSFDKRRVKAQIRSLFLSELINRQQHDYTSSVADYSFVDFCIQHGLPPDNCREEVEAFLSGRGWVRGEDYELGNERVWMGWNCWKDQEDLLRSGEARRGSGEETLAESEEEREQLRPPTSNRYSVHFGESSRGESSEDLLLRRKATTGEGEVYTPNLALGYQDSPELNASAVWSEYPSDRPSLAVPETKELHTGGEEDDGMIIKEKKHHATEVVASTTARKWWLRITWALTWWIPSFLLRKLGRMERADIRMAWREKVAICMMIAFMCGIVIFYIIVFGMLLCPDSAKAWNPTELATHQGTDDYYAAIRGKVYDFTTFYKGQHSDIAAYPTSANVMIMFAGQDLSNYFPPPMTVVCPGLVTNNQLSLLRANFTPLVDYAVHTSGPLQTIPNTALDSNAWYTNELQPALQRYYKGSYVFTRDVVSNQADNEARQWAIYNKKVYDLSDYFFTQQRYSSSSGTDLPNYSFFNKGVSSLFQTNAGQDVTQQMNEALGTMSQQDAENTMTCLDSAFYVGELDYRLTARCTVQNYLLLAFSIILMTTLGIKFLAALQLGSKRQPELLDKFVICQVPCYTEGEESLKRTIDSLAVLKYDDKRKLIFIICDGNIIGSGNNRPTPRIVLDILGVDPALDPEPLLFKSIGEGSKQLNYAKVYSGLYEHEGHVVPYVVVVKVGKPTETSKPGNRGKRDSQVMLLHYLNRVHFDAPMSPLELEIYHQMRNVIGIDPTFYEYIFQVDADTTVEPDSLNRLIACAADDQRIIGICGETKVENERESLTTMIQVYEYYISHHLTKAFESLFGSVTCLPGCFSVYRIRTADKGRPVIISSIVIDEYAEPNVDTLHKKNLFSLGEDRYLTTLMMKHFPTMKMKFTPDAIAHTVAPSRWNVLLSQRRRWINSTIHNLVELLFLPEMCGFCFFSMRFVVFLDLVGTIILPATFAYLVYLVIVVSTGKAAIPIISLAMIAAVYGLQAVIFILKREFMLVGWMFVYILAFPVYSVFLPIYSFWSMDDFSWGNTRKVVGEGSQKTIVYDDDEPFHDSMIPYKSFKEYESNAWETASVHSEKSRATSHASAARTNRSAPQSRHASKPGSRVASMYSTGVPELPAGADFYRDSSPLGPSHSSANLRHSSSHPSLHHAPSNPYFPPPGLAPTNRVQSMAGLSMWDGGSVYDSPAGAYPPVAPLAPMMTGMSAPHNPFERPETVWSGYGQPTGGVAGMGAPRNTVMTNLGGYANRASSYSLTTVAHPLADPPRSSQDPNPSDEKILEVLKQYLAAQDLMSVTKRQTREAIYGLFPNADLQAKAGWINQNIDKILSEM